MPKAPRSTTSRDLGGVLPGGNEASSTWVGEGCPGSLRLGKSEPCRQNNRERVSLIGIAWGCKLRWVGQGTAQSEGLVNEASWMVNHEAPSLYQEGVAGFCFFLSLSSDRQRHQACSTRMRKYRMRFKKKRKASSPVMKCVISKCTHAAMGLHK